MFPPVTGRVKPEECVWKERILPAPGQPGTVVEHAQGAKRLNQAQFTRIEIIELPVPFQQ